MVRWKNSEIYGLRHKNAIQPLQQKKDGVNPIKRKIQKITEFFIYRFLIFIGLTSAPLQFSCVRTNVSFLYTTFPTRCQFHQHFTSFFDASVFWSFYVLTVWFVIFWWNWQQPATKDFSYRRWIPSRRKIKDFFGKKKVPDHQEKRLFIYSTKAFAKNSNLSKIFYSCKYSTVRSVFL